MPMSPYLAGLRGKVGRDLLLLPAVAVIVHDEHGRLLLVRDRSSGDSGALGGEEFRHTYPNGDRVEYAIFAFAGSMDPAGVTGGTDDEEIADVRLFPREGAPALTLPYPEGLLWP